MASGEPTTKKFKHSIISKHIFKPEFQEIFCKNWHDRTPFKNSNIEIITEPFRVCKISRFLKSEDFMDELKNELIDVKTRRKCIDLYQFEQSRDLMEVNTHNIKTLYHTFQTNLSEWLQRNTKIALNETISMSSSCYSDADYLLCHDDNMGDRRIAFVLYLSKSWTEEDGGALDLFDTDELGQPRNVVKSMIPEYNSLVFFEVTNNSYHQVAEVTSLDKSRWSINGWFHGPIVKADKVRRPEPVINYVEPENIEVALGEWISPNYLFIGLSKEIQENVEKQSYTFLPHFLNDKVYLRLSDAMKSADIKWKRVGPPDVRRYEVADEDSLPAILADFCKIFKSIALCQLLRDYTELDLVPTAEYTSPRVTIELQRWSRGCYTLMTDRYDDEESFDNAAGSDKKSPDNTSKCDYEVFGGEGSSSPKSKLSSSQNNYLEEYDTSEQNNLRDETDCNTPPRSPSDDDLDVVDVDAIEENEEEVEEEAEEVEEEEEVTRQRANEQSPPRKERSGADSQQVSPVRDEFAASKPKLINSDSDHDSDVSDIGDYLSDPLDASFDYSEQEEVELERDDESDGGPAPEAVIVEPGELDVIMQFNGSHLDDGTIDYVQPNEKNGALIHVPYKENHLCLVYRTGKTCRVHRYVHYYIKGYFYNLVCTYLE